MLLDRSTFALGQRPVIDQDFGHVTGECAVCARADLCGRRDGGARRSKPGASKVALEIKERLFVRVINRDDGGTGANGAFVNRQRGHVIGAMFVNGDAVGSERQTGAGIEISPMRGTEQVALSGGAADT